MRRNMQNVEIRVKGHIDEHWSSWFEDLAMAQAEGETILTGTVADQAALYGVLARLRDFGLSLQLVNSVEVKPPDEEPRPGSNGDLVTGSGWINSPAGAWPSNPALTGNASFDFLSKHEPGDALPTGWTRFQFSDANLSFCSACQQGLVVAEAKAHYQGSGSINARGDYGFMLTAVDGRQPGGGGVDKFRIKIWDKATGDIVYDNQMDASNTADPATAVGGGSIVIRK
jgi:hypothetical protein